MKSIMDQIYSKLVRLQVGGCTCGTKTPDIQFHHERCTYRLASEIAVLLDSVDIKNAQRYKKLQGWMGSNVEEGWDEVEKMGAICAWMGWDHMDLYLDYLDECNVGLCQRGENETNPR